MQKDFKIGFIVGLVFVTMGMLWLGTRPSLSTKARMQRSQEFQAKKAEAINLSNTTQREIATEEKSVADNIDDVEEVKPSRFHIVKQGDTLSKISLEYYGTASRWKEILNANRGNITDINRLQTGTQLILPE